MSKNAADLQWIATELDDLTLLLRVHRKSILANKLDAIRKSLQSARNTGRRSLPTITAQEKLTFSPS
jgi:hypothetical protein